MAQKQTQQTASTVLIPVSEINPFVGGNIDCGPGTWFEQRGYTKKYVTDWAGRACLPVELAAEAVSAYQREREATRAQEAAYAAYLSDEKAKADAARAAKLKANNEAYQKRVAKMSDEAKRIAELEREARRKKAEEAAARGGRVVDYAEFVKGAR